MNRCPTCNSPKPNLHPAVQVEGEVSLCYDPYHKQITNENTVSFIKQVFGSDKQGAASQHGE